MGVGHDVAIRGEHEARTHTTGLVATVGLLRPLGALLPGRVGHRHPETAEKLQHLLVHAIAATRSCSDFFHGTDIDDRGANLLHQIGEVRQCAGCSTRLRPCGCRWQQCSGRAGGNRRDQGQRGKHFAGEIGHREPFCLYL